MRETGTERQEIDLEDALEKIGGDRALLAELAGLFAQEGPRLIAALRQALANGDRRAMRSAAHSLKGSAGIFCARHTAELAARLEEASAASPLDEAGGIFAKLEGEVVKLQAVLQTLEEGESADVGSRDSAKAEKLRSP